jgi:hypothetical protein
MVVLRTVVYIDGSLGTRAFFRKTILLYNAERRVKKKLHTNSTENGFKTENATINHHSLPIQTNSQTSRKIDTGQPISV